MQVVLLITIQRRSDRMNLFERGDTTASLRATSDEIKKEIERLTNEVICSTDLDELEQYYVAKHQIEEIELFKENISKELTETKIKSYNHFYGGYRSYEPEYYLVDGYRVTFTIPFDGDKNLLDLRPSTFYMQSFPVDRVVAPTEDDYGKILYSMEFPKKELQGKENSNEFVQKRFEQEMKTYFSTIDAINQEVKRYNSGLANTIRQYLNQRLQKANDYLQMRERLELPLKLNENAPNTKPILLKKNKKKKEVTFPDKKAPEKEYEISNADYENIKNIILLACTSMEKSARTFTKLLEEELRDVILSNLNTHYQGTASGETFNKVGKTDIYIPFENKAAYIAECKVWHGNKKFLEAIDQLCGYTTWRDTKTSLIIFNKDNKDFGALLDGIDKSLRGLERCREMLRVGRNQWQGVFTKEADSKDTLTINVTVYDLYVKE